MERWSPGRTPQTRATRRLVSAPAADDWIERLARLFREHPAWVRAARILVPAATSTVYFRHRPGEAWRLEQQDGVTRLLAGGAADPDFVFRFTPAAIERLEAVEGGIGEFAVELFTLMTEEDPDLLVGFRIAVGFPRLLRRGYVRLLVEAGPGVLAFGASHGIRTLGALRRFIAQLRDQDPADWETESGTRR